MVGNGDAPAPREPEGEEEDTGGVVKLISAEGFEFVVDKKAAMVSNTLRATCSHPREASPRRARARSDSRRFPPASSRRSAVGPSRRSLQLISIQHWS
ncbi:hypothetical protein PVAP13_8KG246166 [Panicum virgatum]|uniref:SKP1 component POZ domain-containing protein n=1 Tax=Panicum virgatum TaxID=38727 RepID=A0A8T0PT69_PANVG|nr:hypothetical protein PVAP13_8KG246166 [Panicum virgatum]